jgi:hypothetical protein
MSVEVIAAVIADVNETSAGEENRIINDSGQEESISSTS